MDFVEFCVEAATGQEVGVGAAFYDPAAGDDNDEVGHPHGRESVGDEDGDRAAPPAGSAGGSLESCQDHLETFDDAPGPPGVTLIPAPGHTPGSTIIVIAGPGERAVLLGDVVHSPVQLLEPEWNTIWDVDPVVARRTREHIVRELEVEPPSALTAGHFPGLQFGRLFMAQGRRRWAMRP